MSSFGRVSLFFCLTYYLSGSFVGLRQLGVENRKTPPKYSHLLYDRSDGSPDLDSDWPVLLSVTLLEPRLGEEKGKPR